MRGRRLLVPKGQGVRPTADRVREALFNLTGQDLRGVRVLDLFAGTGAVGIEALSRGAEEAVFVDNSPRVLGVARKNLERCKLEHRAQLHRHDLRRGLPPGMAAPKGSINLVFLDPPYGRDLVPPLLTVLGQCGFLDREALIIAETGAGEALQQQEGSLQLLESRAYGDTGIHLFRLALEHRLPMNQSS